MSKKTMQQMLEATRLTGAGRLSEATALLRNVMVVARSSAARTMNAAPDRTRSAPATATVQPRPLDPGSRFSEHLYTSPVGARAYKLYVPDAYDGAPAPLVVMLHGCTQSPDDFAAGTKMNEIAEERGFLVAYPAQSKSANPSKCWNWFNEADQRRESGEPALIAGIAREIMRNYSIDPARVYAAGLSAGGAAAAIMGVTYPDLFAAVGIHSGLACGAANSLPSAMAAMRQGSIAAMPATSAAGGRAVRAIVFHGDGDKTVASRNGDQVVAQFAGTDSFTAQITDGVVPDGLAYTREVHVVGPGRPSIEQWVVHGAGHAWSGGSPLGSFTEPRGPDASREMARFFLDG